MQQLAPIGRRYLQSQPMQVPAAAHSTSTAFRSQLRKPDFTERPVEEGESPGSQATEQPEVLLGRELAEEGRDIRSVGSSR